MTRQRTGAYRHMNDEQLEALVRSRIQQKRAGGKLRRWIRILLWLNLNVSALLLLAVLARWYYDALKAPKQRFDWIFWGPSRALVGVPVLGVPEAVAWIIWYLPRRPGARLWAGGIGAFVFWMGCGRLFTALAWGLKLLGVHGLLYIYIGISHLLFAFLGDDGATYQFVSRRR